MRKRPVSKGTLVAKKARPFHDSSFSLKNSKILLNMSVPTIHQRLNEDDGPEETKQTIPK